MFSRRNEKDLFFRFNPSNNGAMLVRPRPTRTEVSPNVFPWTMRHLYYVSLRQCVPVRAIPCWGGRIVRGKTSGKISLGDTLS